MCADLFHSGHVNYLRQCCDVAGNVDVHLIVGIHSDATIEGYKRAPVCTMEERISVVECCTYVCEVLADAPLQVTADFMKEHAIDFVVHGTEVPELERRAMYDYPITQGRYAEVPRTGGISTTAIIDRIASRLAVEVKEDEHALPSERKPAAVVVKELREKQKAKTKN
jgi:ethanolamine-phosphate cytidylyltransferase|tara:strand:- start:94 stop:597 length:504 start_codon:yes stop_codon:yes gene_type:complete